MLIVCIFAYGISKHWSLAGLFCFKIQTSEGLGINYLVDVSLLEFFEIQLRIYRGRHLYVWAFDGGGGGGGGGGVPNVS